MRDNMKPCHHALSEDTIYKEVVVIGNGPSGLVTSFMLSGYVPYLRRPIPADLPIDDMLRARLENLPAHQCLYEADLLELAEGLEGRSLNPIPILMDTLLRPCTDIGEQADSLIEWKFDVEKQIEHIVLGRGPPGGSWPTFPPDMVTVSPAHWLTLPPRVREYPRVSEPPCPRVRECPRVNERPAPTPGPIPAAALADYFRQYVQQWGLQRYFRSDVIVNRVTVAPRSGEACDSSVCPHNAAFQVYTYDGRSARGVRYMCSRVSLCAGAADRHNTLPHRVQVHAVSELRRVQRILAALRKDAPTTDETRLAALIVGSGVSAADGVALALGSVLTHHVHRDPAPSLYTLHDHHYTKIYKMMCEGPPPGEKNYINYPEHIIVDVTPTDEKPILQTTDQTLNEETRPKVVKLLNIVTNEIIQLKVIFIAVLIGSKPDLFFLQTNHDFNEDFKEKKCPKCSENKTKSQRQCFLRNHWHYLKSVVGQSLQSCTARYLSQEISNIADDEKALTSYNNNDSDVKCTCNSHLLTADNSLNNGVNNMLNSGQNNVINNSLTTLNNDKINCNCKLNWQKTRINTNNCKCNEVNPFSSGLGFGLDPKKPVDSRSNPLAIDKGTHELLYAPKGVYALGPLTGDNFIRFIPGGALAVVAHIHQTRKESNE